VATSEGFLRSGVSLLLLAAVLWSLVPPEPALSAPEPRSAPLANLQLRWSPLDALNDLLRLLGLRADPPAGTATGAADPGAAGPSHHFGFSAHSRLAQVTGTETPGTATPTLTAEPTTPGTVTPTLTAESTPTPVSTVQPTLSTTPTPWSTPTVVPPAVPIYPSRGELVPGASRCPRRSRRRRHRRRGRRPAAAC
jgi:hypothetical protein